MTRRGWGRRRGLACGRSGGERKGERSDYVIFERIERRS